MRRVLIFTPCRTSFALFVLCTLITDPERCADIQFGEPPRLIQVLQPQGENYA